MPRAAFESQHVTLKAVNFCCSSQVLYTNIKTISKQCLTRKLFGKAIFFKGLNGTKIFILYILEFIWVLVDQNILSMTLSQQLLFFRCPREHKQLTSLGLPSNWTRELPKLCKSRLKGDGSLIWTLVRPNKSHNKLESTGCNQHSDKPCRCPILLEIHWSKLWYGKWFLNRHQTWSAASSRQLLRWWQLSN